MHGVQSALSIGTDEHGQKIIRTANKLAYDHPQTLVDDVTREYSRAFNKFNIAIGKGKLLFLKFPRTVYSLFRDYFWSDFL